MRPEYEVDLSLKLFREGFNCVCGFGSDGHPETLLTFALGFQFDFVSLELLPVLSLDLALVKHEGDYSLEELQLKLLFEGDLVYHDEFVPEIHSHQSYFRIAPLYRFHYLLKIYSNIIGLDDEVGFFEENFSDTFDALDLYFVRGLLNHDEDYV